MMKINKIHIVAFGKLSNFDLTLNDGLNLIYGDNEFGKTTLMAFIKMVFFGTAGGKAGLDRKKYAPWNSKEYAGSIEFEANGIPYRIERKFAATNSHDKITLVNLNNYEPKEISPKEPLGERFFGCTLACFERTLFIGALNDSETESSVLGEINKKLANIVSSGDEDISVNTVSARLLDVRHYFLSKGGKIGACDKAKLKAEEIRETLASERLEYAEKERRLLLLNEIKAEITELNKREAELKARLKIAQGLEKAKALKEFVSCTRELEVLKSSLTLKDGSLLTQRDIYALKEKQTKIEAAKNAVEQKIAFGQNDKALPDNAVADKKIGALCDTAEQLKNEIAEKEASCERLGGKAKAKTSFAIIALCVLGAALIATGAVLGNSLSIPLYCGGAVLIFLFAVLQIISSKKSATAQRDYMNLREEILKQKEHLQEIGNEIAAAKQEKQQSSELKLFALKQKEEELATLKANLEALEADYRLFFSSLPEVHGADEVKKTERLTGLLMDFSALQSKHQALSISLGGITLDSAQREIEALGNQEGTSTPKEIEEEIDAVQNRLRTLNEEYHRSENALSVKYHSLHIPATLQRELRELNDKIEKQEAFCGAVDIALQVLEEASDEMQSSWGGELNSKVSEIFSRITDEKYSDVLVSKSLGLSAEENGSFGLKSIENLSAGTKDQSYFSLRLALCDLIFGENEPFPIFLDDSFERYDDSRAKLALEFLKELANKKQVLLFTCHKSFLDLI